MKPKNSDSGKKLIAGIAREMNQPRLTESVRTNGKMRLHRWLTNLPAVLHSMPGYTMRIWELVVNIVQTSSGAIGETPSRAKYTERGDRCSIRRNPPSVTGLTAMVSFPRFVA